MRLLFGIVLVSKSFSPMSMLWTLSTAVQRPPGLRCRPRGDPERHGPSFPGTEKLEWNLGEAKAKAATTRRPTRAHVIIKPTKRHRCADRRTSPSFQVQLMKFKKACPYSTSSGCWSAAQKITTASPSPRGTSLRRPAPIKSFIREIYNEFRVRPLYIQQ